jgi:hypothetical protein
MREPLPGGYAPNALLLSATWGRVEKAWLSERVSASAPKLPFQPEN